MVMINYISGPQRKHTAWYIPFNIVDWLISIAPACIPSAFQTATYSQWAGSVLSRLCVWFSEELRHSMPNLTPRTSLHSLEAVRNSRSMEANLQSSSNRTSRLPHSPTGWYPTPLLHLHPYPFSSGTAV